jgi:hypothetical protein
MLLPHHVSPSKWPNIFAEHGWEDIPLLSGQPAPIDALNRLARQIHLGLLIESPEVRFSRLQPGCAGRSLDQNRRGRRPHGLPWQQPERILPILDALSRAHHLRVRGLLTHAGNTYGAGSAGEVRQIFTQTSQRLESVRGYIRRKRPPSEAIRR